MKNLLISLKRFFGNKNTITIICVLAGVLILYFAYNYRIKQVTRPITVPYAKVEIQPREQITDSMIGYVEFPSVMVKENVVRLASDIVGKYANYNTVIPAGSLFYRSTLVEWSQMPDSAWADIPDGYTVVSLNVNTETTYGNSIFPGNYIDLYFAAYDDTGKLLFGKLISSIEVLAVKDSSGAHVFENSAELKSPASLIFAVPDDMFVLLRKAGYTSGELVPVPRNKKFSENPDATEVSSQYIRDFIEVKSVCLPGQCVSNTGVGTIE